MKEISIENGEPCDHASREVGSLKSDVNQHVTQSLESLDGDDYANLAVRTHIAELINATRDFGVGVKPTREEMHERGDD